MSGTGLLGDFEQLVLLSILQQRGEGYGLPIRRAIEAATGRTVSRGALYRTLDRLGEKGLVDHTFEEPSADRGGNPRKVFRVTSDGVEALRFARAVVSRLSDGLDELLEPAQ